MRIREHLCRSAIVMFVKASLKKRLTIMLGTLGLLIICFRPQPCHVCCFEQISTLKLIYTLRLLSVAYVC